MIHTLVQGRGGGFGIGICAGWLRLVRHHRSLAHTLARPRFGPAPEVVRVELLLGAVAPSMDMQTSAAWLSSPLVTSDSGKPHMLPPVPPPVPGWPSRDVGGEMGVSERVCVLPSVFVCVNERGGVGVGICLIPLSAGSSDRQLLPHLLPCWTGAC